MFGSLSGNGQYGPQPGFLDKIGTGIGDALIGLNNPYGSIGGINPQDRQRQIGMSLLQLAGAVDGSAKKGGGALEGLGQGIQQLQQGGAQSAQMRMQGLKFQQEQEDRKTELEKKAKQTAALSEYAKSLSPEDQKIAALYPEKLVDAFLKSKSGQEGFTLSPGQQRFNPDGSPIASVPEGMKPPEPFTLSPGQQRFDANGKPVANVPDNSASAPSWNEITTNEGVFLYDKNDPTKKIRVGDRPDRNEGEGRDFTQEKQLRNEYVKAATPYTDLRTNYQKIQASAGDNTGASDIAMVYSFMKMLDPTSVVREGEFATAQNAGGVDSKIISMYNNAINGQRLAPQVRDEFLQQAKRQLDQQMKSYALVRKTYQDLGRSYKLDPDKIAPDLTYGVTSAPDKPPAPASNVDDLVKRYRSK